MFISSIIEIVEYEVMKMEYMERPKYIKQILLDIKEELDNNMIIVGDFNIPLT